MLHLLTQDDEWCRAATTCTLELDPAASVWKGRHGQPRPSIAVDRGDLLISFLCPWVLPADLLHQAALAVNFHPGSSAYPGMGCYNFALYDHTPVYGVVCHHMLPVPDTGRILAEDLFPIRDDDSVESLKYRTREALLVMFRRVLPNVLAGRLPECDVMWKRAPYRRNDLEALRHITSDMPREEMVRRIRATSYPGCPPPVLRLNGIDFEVRVPNRNPLA
jgi:methionyl-tRNA formyltransferase